MRHLTIRIRGRVQGVGFRYAAEKKVRKLEIAGFAQNEPDGSVYVEAEGEEAALQKFLTWCGRGPWYAKVERVDSEWSDEVKGFSDFTRR